MPWHRIFRHLQNFTSTSIPIVFHLQILRLKAAPAQKRVKGQHVPSEQSERGRIKEKYVFVCTWVFSYKGIYVDQTVGGVFSDSIILQGLKSIALSLSLSSVFPTRTPTFVGNFEVVAINNLKYIENGSKDQLPTSKL